MKQIHLLERIEEALVVLVTISNTTINRRSQLTRERTKEHIKVNNKVSVKFLCFSHGMFFCHQNDNK